MQVNLCQSRCEAKIKILSEQDISAPAGPCVVRSYERSRLTVSVSTPVAVNQSVNVEYDDALFLGDVIACHPENSVYVVVVLVEQVLHGLQELLALRASLLQEEPEREPVPISKQKVGKGV